MREHVVGIGPHRGKLDKQLPGILDGEGDSRLRDGPLRDGQLQGTDLQLVPGRQTRPADGLTVEADGEWDRTHRRDKSVAFAESTRGPFGERLRRLLLGGSIGAGEDVLSDPLVGLHLIGVAARPDFDAHSFTSLPRGGSSGLQGD